MSMTTQNERNQQMQEITDRIISEFHSIQISEIGADILTIIPTDSDILRSYEVVFNNCLYFRNTTPPIDDYCRNIIEELYRNHEVELSWNNTGTIFWRKG